LCFAGKCKVIKSLVPSQDSSGSSEAGQEYVCREHSTSVQEQGNVETEGKIDPSVTINYRLAQQKRMRAGVEIGELFSKVAMCCVALSCLM
jgi:hypothetical protein